MPPGKKPGPPGGRQPGKFKVHCRDAERAEKTAEKLFCELRNVRRRLTATDSRCLSCKFNSILILCVSSAFSASLR